MKLTFYLPIVLRDKIFEMIIRNIYKKQWEKKHQFHHFPLWRLRKLKKFHHHISPLSPLEVIHTGMQTFSESEKSIEQYLVKAVHIRHGLCLKFVSPGHTGVPDRVIILESIVYFAEIKAPGGRLSASQQAMHRKLRAAGARVVTLYSREEVDEFINEISPA